MNRVWGPRRLARASALSLALCATGRGLAEEPFQAQVRLLSHNVFGKAEQECAQRMRGFGTIVADAAPAYDVVGLTEYYGNTDANIWSCDSDHLLNGIQCGGRYLAPNNRKLFQPEHGFYPDGGLGVFTLGAICDFESHTWSYQDGLEPRQGVILTRIELPGRNVTLDVYVVHLHSEDADGCDRCCRKGQLAELRDFIAAHSQRSGNPVIAMGDFNIAGPPTCCGPTGYEYIVTLLKNPRDLWYEAHPCGQSNCGDGTIACDETNIDIPCDRHECDGFAYPEVHRCLANPDVCDAVFCNDIEPVPDCPPEAQHWGAWAGYTWDGCLNEMVGGQERIDYIFVVTDPALSSSAFDLELLDAKVADFMAVIDPPPDCPPCLFPNCLGCELVDPPPFVGHVSDHLGVEATLEIRGRSAVWVDNLATGPELGTSCAPFDTVAEGVAAAAPGQRTLIRSAAYPSPITINKAVRLQALGGTVRLGGYVICRAPATCLRLAGERRR